MDLVIKETLEKLLEVLGITFTSIKVSEENEKVFYVEIETDNSSLLIGWHGETLRALQHILKCLLWKNGIESNVQVVLDVDGYKKRQEESVIRLAENKARWVIDNQKPVKLPPMNPYFRRKIHLHLANSDDYKNTVSTESVGDGYERQIKIAPM
jgi:spoIIIJ-associated protein